MPIFSARAVVELTPAQKHLYATETAVNFRLIAKLVATHSRRILTSADLASPDLRAELAIYIQFVELSYGVMPVEVVYQNLDILSQPNYPLEHSDAVCESKLLKCFHGSVANLHAFTAYLPSKKQLILAISGTRTVKHALYDLRAIKTSYPRGKGCAVHTGFWKLYIGIKENAMQSIQEATRQLPEDIQEVVITGHSMGGAVGALLALDLLSDQVGLLSGCSLKVAFFGSPRVGNAELAQYWRKSIQTHRKRYGETSVQEYFVKGYNDGVPSLPPYKAGYRHLSQSHLYSTDGRLYHIPPSECEHGFFDVAYSPDPSAKTLYPRGGHNYYSDRDLERMGRHFAWLTENMNVRPDWEDRYYKAIVKREQAWRHKTNDKGKPLDTPAASLLPRICGSK